MAVIKLKISDEQFEEIQNGKLNVVLFNKEELEDTSAGLAGVLAQQTKAALLARGDSSVLELEAIAGVSVAPGWSTYPDFEVSEAGANESVVREVTNESLPFF